MEINQVLKKCKEVLKTTFKMISGSEKRVLAAEIAKECGYGGVSYVAKEFGIGRETIKKGMRELETGIHCKDAFNMRGRKTITEIIPTLATDIEEIADAHSQIDPKFQSEKIYTKMSAKSVKDALIKKGYTNEELPTERTIRNVLNKMGYTQKKVQKTKPLERINETDAIFENLTRMHEEISKDETVMRLSIDTKDRVKVGEFSRNGKSRVNVEAYDHDFCNKFVVPFGIMDVKEKRVEITMTETKVTADFMVDRLEAYWSKNGTNKKVLVLNADNGPENNSRRTQFIKRMVEFSAKMDITIYLAYYPPYHSKYNPIERVWGVLENHWNGSLLDCTETIVQFAESMTYAGEHPTVLLEDKPYATGVKLTTKVMAVYENALERMKGIEKWFIKIVPSKCRKVLDMQLNL